MTEKIIKATAMPFFLFMALLLYLGELLYWDRVLGYWLHILGLY